MNFSGKHWTQFLIALLLSGCLVSCAVKTGGRDDTVELQQDIASAKAEDLVIMITALEKDLDQLRLKQQESEDIIQRLTQKVLTLENKLQALSGNKIPDRPAPSPSPVSGPEKLYHKARNLLLENSPSEALVLFRDFLEAYPDHSLADNAMYWMGECYYSMKLFKNAAQTFQKLVRQYPKGLKVPDAILKTGYSYLSLKDMNRAHHYLKQVVTQFPFSDAAEKAQQKLSTFN